ncbi:MAG TPA: CdaR family protein [Malonomonas sp.]
MFKLLTENWTLKLISLVFALVLWTFIMGERRLEVGYRIPLELQAIPQGLMVANEVPNLVDIRISGPRTLLTKFSPNDFSIVVDLKDLRPGLTTFKRLEERLSLPSGLRVTRVSPSFIDLKLERIKSKLVPIKIVLAGEPFQGYQLSSIKAVPAQVAIEGAESEMKSVTQVTTEPVDLTGVNESFSLIVPLEYQGTYTRFQNEKTTEVQVVIQALEQLQQESADALEKP